MFTVLVEKSVLEKIRSFPAKEAARLKEQLKTLGNSPFPDGRDKKLIQGSRHDACRFRVGGYRFFYVFDTEKKTVKVTQLLSAEQAHKLYGRID